MLGIVENSLKSWQGNVILSTQFATKVPMQIGLGKVETNSLERHQPSGRSAFPRKDVSGLHCIDEHKGNAI